MRRLLAGILVAGLILLTGCGRRELIQTPNLYANGRIDPFKDCPPSARNNRVDVLYATDRLPVESKGAGQEYGYLRSPSLAYGICRVEIGEDVPWSVLAENSRTDDRDISLPLSVRGVDEVGRFPGTPIPFIRRGGELVEDPAVLARKAQAEDAFRALVAKRLTQTPRKEAFVFVHGYNNDFEDSVLVMAELWHFLGRTGLPIVYSWPAGRGGFRGYTYDRESGEFTILHLKEFLGLLGSCPGLERVHFLAHSRGTDVLISAVRELIIEARAAGKSPREILKIADLTLAAPDLDLEVFTQRMVGERLGQGMGGVTLYVSDEDKALGLSTWLFSGLQRVGRVTFEDLNPELRKRLEQNHGAAVIDARVRSGFIGHSYFYSNPAVSSDLILMMRYGRAPGAENGRPLVPVGPNFWEIDKGYPYRNRD